MNVLAYVLNGLPYLIYGPGKEALSHTLEYGASVISDKMVDNTGICHRNGGSK